MEFCWNCSLKEYNTFGIDAMAHLLVKYSSEGELLAFLEQYRREMSHLPLLHIGAGSNLLFLSDYSGVILFSEIKDIKIESENEDAILVSVGAGVTHDDFVLYAIQHGWYGLENLSLIPGQVGSSAVQNIGAYGVEVGDLIKSVQTISLEDGTCKTWNHDELAYSYRHSIFKDEAFRGKYAICHVVFQLKKRFTPCLSYGGLTSFIQAKNIQQETLSALQLREIIIGIREKKLPDPKVTGNAGSFFMNPIVSNDILYRIQKQYPDVPSYVVDTEHVKIPAGWLIEQCGWKGKALGPAAVHDKQALVLVNRGGATGKDILSLCKAVQESVYEKFGMRLSPEVNFIGGV
ncbi:MAG: UDP-N-acetylmuramate dehydrogenase [Bacteroidaceae bacterium]|nr:UDP-N-acetylmuramate dehydrogenase [Bacteroidaceae bacterium]